jgi:hypothetical protein
VPKYAKGPPPLQRKAATAPAPVLLRVTLGDMPLQDAYRVSAPWVNPDETLEGLLSRMFPVPSSTLIDEEILPSPTTDPDSLAMQAELSKMIYDAQAARCSLSFFVNHGPEIEPVDVFAPHLRETGSGAEWLLDLVIEQRFTPLEYAVARGDWPGVPELVAWLEDGDALFLTDEDGLRALDATVLRLVEQGLVEPKASPGQGALTETGHARRQELLAEAESYAEKYGIFEDVLYDEEAQVADFGTGHGQDLRSLVYEADGLDSLRATFLAGMLLATDDRVGVGDPEQDFLALLTPAVDRPLMGDADVEQIIEAGLALVEADAEARQREIARRQAIRHAKRQTRPQRGDAQP